MLTMFFYGLTIIFLFERKRKNQKWTKNNFHIHFYNYEKIASQVQNKNWKNNKKLKRFSKNKVQWSTLRIKHGLRWKDKAQAEHDIHVHEKGEGRPVVQAGATVRTDLASNRSAESDHIQSKPGRKGALSYSYISLYLLLISAGMYIIIHKWGNRVKSKFVEWGFYRGQGRAFIVHKTGTLNSYVS